MRGERPRSGSKKVSVTNKNKTMNTKSKYAESIAIDLYNLTIPAPIEDAIEEVAIFRNIWGDGETTESRKILGKKIVRRALRRALGKDVYDRAVRLTAVGATNGQYTIKLTKEAVDALVEATSDNSRLDSVYSRLSYIIYNSNSESED